MKILILLALFIFGLSEITLSDQKTDRLNAFRQLSITRGWELGLWRIRNEKNNDDSARLFKLSMTAQAFHYWILTKDGIIERSLVFEQQIRKTFSSGALDAETLKNPLNRDAKNNGGFGVGLVLTAETYKKLSLEFEEYFVQVK